MLERLSKADFAQNVNTFFQCRLGAGRAIELQLVELREGRSSSRQEQFALLFCGPHAAPLAQGMYPLQHQLLGEFELFIVPVARDAQGLYYEAVFNRLLPTDA